MKVIALLVTLAAQDPSGQLRDPTPRVPLAQPPQVQRVLALRIDGVTKATITDEDIGKMTPLPLSQGVGGKTRVYSLRDAIAKVAGPNARLVTVVLVGGERVTVDPKNWDDPKRTPILWQNRRGLFKAGWIDEYGKPYPGAPEWRDIAALEIKP